LWDALTAADSAAANPLLLVSAIELHRTHLDAVVGARAPHGQHRRDRR
jgi:hypothetical protein